VALPAYELEESFLEKDVHSEQAYFTWEDRSPHRWEFLPTETPGEPGERLGIIRAMSGGTAAHSAIAANLITSLNNEFRRQTPGNCRPFGSDLKVHCPDGRNTYPDVTVVCGPLQFYRDRRDIVLNPVLIAEVLSPSTAQDDEGSKRRSYQTITTLQYYMLIAADEVRVEMYAREEGSEWRYELWKAPSSLVALPTLGIEVPLADLYIQVDLLAQ